MVSILALVLLPVIAGIAVVAAGDRRLLALRLPVLLALVGTVAVAAVATATEPSVALRWGAGLTLRLEIVSVARGPIVLVAFVALAVVAYAFGYGPERGRARMVGLLLVFAGTMELLLVSADLLTLLIAWELVGALSWGLISHRWRADAPAKAAHAFIATRVGDLGLFLAAGAAYAASASLAMDDLAGIEGRNAQVLAAGVLLAAAAKSAQGPFAPWLFSAMAGPTPASALLHSATMVAAGAYLLARLQPVLDTVNWFGSATVALGLVTAIAGGMVAAVTPEAKRLLAGSTSAQYGLMFVAVGAGYPGVALAHLVVHGLFKALLFISAGVAIEESGSERLSTMTLGRRFPVVAAASAVGALALAAVPPLAGAWTKEEIVAAGAHVAPWIGGVLVVAGGLSAFYAARFHLALFDGGPTGTDPATPGRSPAEPSLLLLAVPSVVLGAVWLPALGDRVPDVVGGGLPEGAAWEVVASLGAVAIGIAVATALARRGGLAEVTSSRATQLVADWFGIPGAVKVAVVDPVLVLARWASTFDDRVVDAGVRGVAAVGAAASRTLARGDDRVVDAGVRGVARFGTWAAGALDRLAEAGFDGAVGGLAGLTSRAGQASRRLQSGQAHQYLAGIVVGVAVLVTVALMWR